MSAHHHAAADRTPSHGGAAKRTGRFVLGFLRAHLIALAVISGLLLLYTLAGFFLVPSIARTQIESYVTDTLHRKAEIGQVRFNPFAFDASIAGLKLTESDGAPLVSFRHLYLNAEPAASLWERAFVLKDLQLSGLNVQTVIAGDGSVNLAKLVPKSSEPPAAEPTTLPRVRIEHLAITQGRVGLEDHTSVQPFIAAVSPITFTLNNFRTDAGYHSPYQFSGATASGEQLEWAGDFTLQPVGSTGQFRVQDLRLTTIDAYMHDSLPFKLASGRALTQGSYAFQLEPFMLDVILPTLSVRDLTLTERRLGAGVPVKLPEIDVVNLVFSLGKHDIGLQRVDMRNAHIDVAREQDGSIDLQRLLQTPAATERPDSTSSVTASAQTPTPPSKADAPSSNDSSEDTSAWNVHVDTIQVANAVVNAEDRAVTPATHFELAPFDVTVNGWSTDPRSKLQVDANLGINKEGRLAGKGDVQLEPLTTSLAFELTDFGLPVLQPYFEQATAVTLHNGKLSAKGTVSYAASPEKAPPLEFAGEVRLAGLRTTDQLENQDLLNWRDIRLSGIQAGLNPDRFAIDRVVVQQPYAAVIIAQDGTLNVARALSSGAPEDAAPASGHDGRTDTGTAAERTAAKVPSTKSDAPAPAETRRAGSEKTFPISIRTVEVVDGTMNFADHSIQPAFSTGIMELNGKVTGLSSKEDSRAKMSLAGKVDKYAPVDINGEMNLFAATQYTQVAMSFRNMELTTFNPYSGKFAGYNISRGKLNTELKYHVVERKLQAEHHIVLDNLQFGDKTDSKEAAPIPIKLGVALLKDRNGIIDLDVPVSGTLDDPQFRLGPIIWKAVLNILTKIVTAPFAALGALFGGGDDLAYVDFPAGSAALAPADAEKLNKLSKALLERPAVRLVVPLTVTNEQDVKAMAQASLAAKFPQGIPEGDSERAKRTRLKAFEEVHKTLTNTAPQFPPETMQDGAPDVDKQLAWLEQTLMAKLEPDEAALDALGQQRARAVQDVLLSNTELSPERVFLASGQGESKTEGDKVRMEMQLE